MIWISADDVIALHSLVIQKSGGMDGLRDRSVLESAISAPLQSFGGIELFPGDIDKIARVGFGLAFNHAFLDGNKRIGAHAMLVFLALNGIELDYTQEELSAIILRIAAGEASSEELLDWLLNHEQN